jgi:hypothetical protein
VADGVAHLRVIATETVDPADHQRVATPQFVVQPATFGAFGKVCAQPGDAVVGYDLVDEEA